jgi:hypothetical protein
MATQLTMAAHVYFIVLRFCTVVLIPPQAMSCEAIPFLLAINFCVLLEPLGLPFQMSELFALFF